MKLTNKEKTAQKPRYMTVDSVRKNIRIRMHQSGSMRNRTT